jgi:hypothetical protein
MKKIIVTIGFILCMIAGVVDSTSAFTTVTYQTYPVSNSSLVIQQEKIVTTTGFGEDRDTTITYQYYLLITPEPQHQALQRIEYVGFRVVNNNGFQYFQIFPNGQIRELTDINQALYEPSKIVLNPADIGQYKLFSHAISNNLTGVQNSVCINGTQLFNVPGSNSIQGINFMAGYGFLTQANMNMIAQQKAIENDPVIQAQVPAVQLLDIQTMKWSMAQANMFQHQKYYNIYDLTNSCQNNNNQWYTP